MIIQIDKLSQVPIYIQLTNQLKRLIILGDLKDHESLPSVRSLAGDLGVNMHTVNKAYNILVEENILTKNQQGYVVNPDRSITKDRLNDLEKRIENLLLDIFIHNVPTQEIKEIFNQKMKNLKMEE
ncbi:MAG TPA: GntR family transcriptional regulator [Alloiococcus sp.]|nr:GntR family transcriptional regulator [Alloiococcus sp.]